MYITSYKQNKKLQTIKNISAGVYIVENELRQYFEMILGTIILHIILYRTL